MKILNTLFLIIGIWVIGKAQTERYLDFSIGLKKYQSRDQYQSPLTYKGWALSRGVGISSVKDKQQVRDHLERLTGQLRTGTANSNTLNYSGVDYRSQRFQLVDQSTDINYYVGVSIKAVFGFRTRSNRSQYDTSVSLCLVGAASYQKAPDDRWSHEALLSLPFFSWSVRPRYTSPYYLKPGAKWKRPSHLFNTIPKFMGFDFQIGSRWEMNNGNAFRIAYESQYYQILPLHPVRVFNHGLVTTASMKIK